MLRIYLKVTIEKKWLTQNFDFPSLKNSSPGQFLGSSNSRRCHWILNFLLQVKDQRSGNKTVWEWKIPHTILER